MIDTVKKKVLLNKGKKKSFKFRGSRNQVVEFDGIIKDIYPAIFTIKLSNNKIETFSYSDVLIENLQILD